MRDRRKGQRRDSDATAQRETRRRNNRRKRPERRSARRVDVDLWVEQERGKEVCFRHVGDLSVGGVRLDQGLSYPVGTEVRLRLSLPGEARPIHVMAEVVAVRAVGSAAQTSLRFVDMHAEDRVRVNAFVDSVT